MSLTVLGFKSTCTEYFSLFQSKGKKNSIMIGFSKGKKNSITIGFSR